LFEDVENDGSDSNSSTTQDPNASAAKVTQESNLPIITSQKKEDITINVADASIAFDEEVSMFTKNELENMFHLSELSNDDPVILTDILHSDEFLETRNKFADKFGDDFWSEEVFENANMKIEDGKATKAEVMQWAQVLSMRPHYIPNLFSTRTAYEFYDAETIKSRESIQSWSHNSMYLSPMMKGVEHKSGSQSDSQGLTVSANNDGGLPIWSDESLHMIFEALDPGQTNVIQLEDFICSKGTRNDETREKIKKIMGKDFFSPEMFETIDEGGTGKVSRAQFVYWCRANLTRQSQSYRNDSPSVSVCMSEEESGPSTGGPPAFLPPKFELPS